MFTKTSKVGYYNLKICVIATVNERYRLLSVRYKACFVQKIAFVLTKFNKLLPTELHF